jgi:hypothetical protein
LLISITLKNVFSANLSLNAAEYSWSPLFDNVQVGIRNYLTKTKTLENNDYKVLNTSNDINGFKIAKSTVFSNSYQDIYKQRLAIPTTGGKYIGSFLARASVEGHLINCFFYSPDTTIKSTSSTGQVINAIDGRADVTLSTTWKRYWVIWEETDPGVAKTVIFGRTYNNAVTVEIAAPAFYIGDTTKDHMNAPEDIEEDIDSKADAANTIQRLNELAEAQRIAEAELEAKATASELAAWVQAYQDFVRATGTQQKDAERKFAEISANVNKIVTDYGDSVTRWQYVNGYMDVADQGLKLGRDGDSTSILIQNNRISMISAGEEVMSISEGVIQIDNGVFTKTLRIGRFREEQYEANPDMNVIRYVGP